MGRRKIPQVVQLPSGDLYLGRSDQDVCTREYLEEKLQVSLSASRPATLYALSTLNQIDRLEALFKEYCSLVQLDPVETLRECARERMENFLHWLLKTFTIKKTSTVTTYWRQLSQLYIKWENRRMDPQVLRQMFVFIEGLLTEEYGLDNTDTEKPLLEAEDFVELLRYHWASDINVFPNERQRLQLATILLLAAFTGSRPQALLYITYRDLNLYVEKDKETGRHHLKLGVTLTKTKSGKKRKRPKTYTFDLDDNPLFCVIAHLVSLAFDDEAFAAPGLVSPDILYRLEAKGEGGCQRITWKTEVLDVPLFRQARPTGRGVETSPDQGLTYGVYQSWVKRLGEALGYTQPLSTYCLRRALGNAINDDPSSSAAVRNLVLDHVGSSTIFERNYLSRMIRYSTQDAFWGRETDPGGAKTASRIGRLRDIDRPKRLTAEQNRQVRQLPTVANLIETRALLRQKIRDRFGALKIAEGEPVYDDYQALGRVVVSTIRHHERALLSQVQREYDIAAPVEAIQKQIRGDLPDSDQTAEPRDAPEPLIPERRLLAEAALSDPSRFTGSKAIHVKCCRCMIALCKRRELQLKGGRRRRGSPDSKVPEGRTAPSKRKWREATEHGDTDEAPLQCREYQCLFCLASDQLPLENAQYTYNSKFSLRRHVDRHHLNGYADGERVACPDQEACGGLIFKGKLHFKNHASRIHAFTL